MGVPSGLVRKVSREGGRRLALLYTGDVVKPCLLSIPMHIRCASAGGVEGLQLLPFADANTKGVCACFRMEACDGRITTLLILAQSNRSQRTLPQLELIEDVLDAKPRDYVTKVYSGVQCGHTLWKDSNVTLCWVQGAVEKRKLFITNRVTDIQRLATQRRYTHCPG